VKKYLLTGLLVWVPISITLWVLYLTIGTMDQVQDLLPKQWRPGTLLGQHIPGLGQRIPGLGLLLTFAVVLITGLLVRNVFGQKLLELWDGLLRHIPIVNSIYGSVKQVSDTLLSGSGKAFHKVLLVRYPHPDAWSLAFQTTVPGEVSKVLDEEYVGVFVPTAPSPVNGFYFFLPRSDVQELDITVDAAFKVIVSMGVAATPNDADQPKQ